jgi:predicted membrane channel-forming protein YqfA (hemolysin III family)
MILIISTIIVLCIVVVSVTRDEPEILIFLLFPIVIGYGLLGTAIPVKDKEESKRVSSICSPELGRCELIVGNNTHETSNFTLVDWFIKNPADTTYLIIKQVNSYGGCINTTIVLPNNYRCTL